jgi:hypothetical protein
MRGGIRRILILAWDLTPELRTTLKTLAFFIQFPYSHPVIHAQPSFVAYSITVITGSEERLIS